GLKHIFTRPYRPQTNGKAERFIQTALREWAYARAYDTSDQRAKDLPTWLHHYNWHRPHGSLKSKPPISRLALHEDTLLSFHSYPTLPTEPHTASPSLSFTHHKELFPETASRTLP